MCGCVSLFSDWFCHILEVGGQFIGRGIRDRVGWVVIKEPEELRSLLTAFAVSLISKVSINRSLLEDFQRAVASLLSEVLEILFSEDFCLFIFAGNKQSVTASRYFKE